MKAIVIIALFVALVVLGPFLLIWALNTLVPTLAIPFTFTTWLAAFVIGLTLRGGGK